MSNPRSVKKGLLVAVFTLLGLILACGGSGIGIDIQFEPENVRIEGLPMFVCPTNTPMPTQIQPPTAIQPTMHATASGYVTYTPVPHPTFTPSGVIVILPLETYTPTTTNTSLPGGIYSTPAGHRPGMTSTSRPTYTPYPSATPYIATYSYFFDDEVYTDQAASALRLRLRIGNVRTAVSSRFDDRQIALFEVEVANRGEVFYVLLAPIQIYVAEVDGIAGGWWVSGDAARDAGITLADAAIDGVRLDPGQTVTFEMAAYVPVGSVDAIAWILDPFANGYDGHIAGGNVAYWRRGSRDDCVGRIRDDFNPPPNLTPNPTATPTLPVNICTGMLCATVMP